ncbi:MAG TPA: glycine cleavage system aminomethyltransferase GcvT [Candidatus Thermoplasmatota archaeon]|nr:glycine cleavage system aminomethyltransferase GcvT [Candidatus Thermoplasmatota archaeon]
MSKRTALYDAHARLGARFVDFAGWEMPIQYTSILDEHRAVRERVGVFDVSHMSNLWVTGPDAETTLSRAFVANAARVPVGGTKYTCALAGDGTILDDLYIFHHPRGFHVVPNAGRNEIIAGRLRELGQADVRDVTGDTCIIALQGPQAGTTLAKALGRDLKELQRFHLTQAPELGGPEAFISRTGYTGEDGFELFLPGAEAPGIFARLCAAGAQPCGLGARDTLRLEKGYCLAGNEFDPPRTPLEAGLSWLVQWDHDFAGRAALEAQKARGEHDRLVGLRADGKGVPRRGCPVHVPGGPNVGTVSSGTLSPSSGVGIALAYVRPEQAKPGTALDIDVRGRALAAEVVKLPFV